MYFVVCMGWILGSDRLLAVAGLPTEAKLWIGTFKGWLFVLVTSLCLFALIRRQQESVRAAHQASLKASMEIANRLAQAIELRDVCTGEHIHRIAAYCRIVGAEMGLSPARLDQLERAAPLHDVGKIAISDAILQKSGPLDPSEADLVRQHAVFGAELLRAEGNEFMELASTIARTHHENWNGTGYPFGLRGEEIPLEGRIVAVCDVLDALLSERPYKRPWPFDDAVAEIERQSGEKFDPAVVSALMRVIPSIQAAYLRTSISVDVEIRPNPMVVV